MTITETIMDENKEKEEIKEYAGGWMTERVGTKIPLFLKIAWAIIALSMTTYLIVYRNGETEHADRGVLVQAFNRVTGTADGFMYFVAALILTFLGILLFFVFGKSRD
jgi:hypothetical protein